MMQGNSVQSFSSMRKVFQALIEQREQLRSYRKVYVGYSGGLDSTVLLHQLINLGLKNIHAIHINHQLMPAADSWEQHCAATAAAWSCPFTSKKVNLSVQGGGLEAAARQARYRVFAEMAGEDDVLVTAHHADDQAETLMFRLLRGAGLKGLAAVREKTLVQHAGVRLKVLRPFLSCQQEQLAEYAQAHRLGWIEDSSNSDEQFDRNFIRHTVLPAVQTRWPAACERMADSAKLLAESDRLLDEYLENDLESCGPRKERLGESICLDTLQQFTWLKQKHLLRLWIASKYYLLPEQKHVKEILKLLSAAADSRPDVSWGAGESGCRLLRFQQRLYLLPRIELSAPSPLEWDISSPLVLGNTSTLSGKLAETGLAPGNYRVRCREGGERCHPEFRDKSQTLKKLLQECRLEPWLRDCVPLVYQGSNLVAVGDLWICKGFAVPGGWRLRWQFKAP